MDYLIIVLLLILSGIFSGLTLSLMSLNKEDLKRKAEVGDKTAQKIYKIRKNGNLLLCTLIIGNVAVNSILAIFLGSLTSGFLAGILATALIVIFGEIMPQALFSRYAFKISGYFVFLARFFIFIFYPLSSPIAWALNKVLGEEMPSVYTKKELEKLIESQEDNPKSPLDADEERIIKGALNFSDKDVSSVMTPENVVFMIEADSILDKKLINQIKEKAFTRIPVYKKEKENIIGILYVKDLLNIETGRFKVEEVARKKVIFMEASKKLDEALNNFITNRIHLAIVVNDFGNFEGVVTLEDVLEEIMNVEIVDEDDKFVDLRKIAKEKVKKLSFLRKRKFH